MRTLSGRAAAVTGAQAENADVCENRGSPWAGAQRERGEWLEKGENSLDIGKHIVFPHISPQRSEE